jgi:PAS domain S-box-containing protein
VLVYFAWRRRTVPFPALFWLFSCFILACGFTHLLEAISFHRPVYRLAGLMKLVTALVSWGTVIALSIILPRALDLRWEVESHEFGILLGGDPERRAQTWTRYAMAALVMGVAGLARVALEPALADRLRYLPFVVAQVFAAWFGGFGPGLLALLEGVVFTSYWIVPPARESPQALLSDQIGLGLFVVTGLAVALISEAQGAAHRRAKVSLAEVTEKRRELEEEVRRRRGAEAGLRQNENQLRRQAAHLAIAQRETAESLALLDALISHAPVGLAFFDAPGRLLRANRLFVEMIGIGDGPWVGRPLADLPPAIAAEIGRDFEFVAQTGQRVLDRLVQLPGLKAAGGRVWQLSLYPVSAAGTALLGVGVVAQEITERIQAQRELEASEARFRALADSVPQIVWVTRADGAATYFNSRWYEYTGSTPDQSLPDGWIERVHPEDRLATVERWDQSVTTGEPYEIEYRIRGEDDTYRWFLGRGVPQRDERGAVAQWFGSCTDIDDRRRAAETLERLVHDRTAELRRSNRALEEFAYVASHDLQEPLRKIQAFGDRLHARYRDALGDQGREYLDRILNSSQRMRTLITDLLSFSRVTTQARPFEAVNLFDLVTDLLSDLEGRLQQTEGTVHVGPLPVVRADPLQMRQLFLNLISNALKFHRPGVPPEVHVESRFLDDTPRPGADGAGASRCEIAVRDNGIGFDEVYRDRIFQVFQRLHGRQEYDGTGVGLAICRRIVERHQGQITARSAPGDGATFLVTLPVDGPADTEPTHAS